MTHKNYSDNTIPDEVQQPIRNRLRVARNARNIFQHEVGVVSSGVVGHFELHNISTMTFGQAYWIADRYGIQFQDFIKFLVDDSDDTSFENRILLALAALDDQDKQLAYDLIRQLVGRNLDVQSETTRGVHGTAA